MMRGDSLRDFYAKSLALLGLAFLGALGAAVDYWPTNLSIPPTAGFDFQIATLQPLTNVTLPATTVAVTRHVTARPVVAAIIPAPPASAIVETIATNLPEPQSLAATKPDLQFAAPLAFGGLSDSANAAIDLTAPEQTQTTEISVTAEARPPMSPAQKNGMLSGFVSSLSDTSSKAGSALANGLQAFGGAVGGGLRKLLPFGHSDDHQRQMIRDFTMASTSTPGRSQ